MVGTLVIRSRYKQRQGRWLSRFFLASAGLCLAWLTLADDKGPIIPPAKGEQCVAESNFMRRNHMQLLIHQRDETVIRGIREEPFSLAECVACHAQSDPAGRPIRVDGDGQFCQSCHAYTAVKIDCFGCHAALPDQAASVPAPRDSALSSITPADSEAVINLATYRYGHIEKNNSGD